MSPVTIAWTGGRSSRRCAKVFAEPAKAPAKNVPRVRPGHAIRLFALSGARQKVGSNNDVFGVLYQITWLSGP